MTTPKRMDQYCSLEGVFSVLFVKIRLELTTRARGINNKYILYLAIRSDATRSPAGDALHMKYSLFQLTGN